jgi:3-methylcrotonyl-CoA carboxylase alpha subunit
VAKVTRVGPGTYRVEHDGGRQEIVYVAGPRGSTWAFWNGELFHETSASASPDHSGQARPLGARMLSSPMPATIIKVMAAPGSSVKRGDTLLVVEAMKMELPIVAEYDGTVKAVHCHEGDLVQAGQTLIELE